MSNEMGGGPSKRACITSACMPCRARKSKCDGERPSCSACTRVYKTGNECYYDLDQDRRRKGALKREIKELSGEITSASEIISSQKELINLLRTGEPAHAYEVLHVLKSEPEDRLDSAEGLKTIIERSRSGGLKRRYETFKDANSPNIALPDPNKHAIPGNDMIESYTGAWTNVTQDHGFVRSLMKLYFVWYHPSHQLFSERLFVKSMHNQSLRYSSPLLVNSICSLGCYLSTDPAARADPQNPLTVGSHFFSECERLLAICVNRPSLVIIQSLGLMAIHQAMKNNECEARRYASQMMSMAVTIGLQRPDTVPLNSKLSAEDIQARRITFWGCFNLETTWALCKGQDGRISAFSHLDNQPEMPVLTIEQDNTPWIPYGIPQLNGLQLSSYQHSLLLHYSHLSKVIDGVILTLRLPLDQMLNEQLEIRHGKLKEWQKNLPEFLHVRDVGAPLPQAVALHMLYHNAVILLFRPFMNISSLGDKGPSHAHAMCTQSAMKVSALLKLFSTFYGFKKLIFLNYYCIVNAASIHVFNINQYTLSADARRYSVDFVAQAIYALLEIREVTTLVDGCLRSIHWLVGKWCKVSPPKIKQAFDAVLAGHPHMFEDSLKHSQDHSPGKQDSSSLNFLGSTSNMITNANSHMMGQEKPQVILPYLTPAESPEEIDKQLFGAGNINNHFARGMLAPETRTFTAPPINQMAANVTFMIERNGPLDYSEFMAGDRPVNTLATNVTFNLESNSHNNYNEFLHEDEDNFSSLYSSLQADA